MKTLPRTRRLSTGQYEFSYKGHRVELIDLRLHGDRGWIAPCDGSNDQEALPTKREALKQAIRNIDCRG